MVRFVANVLRHTDYIVEEMLGIKSRIVPILQLVHNLISFDAVEGQVEELHVLKSAIALRVSAEFGIIQASLASALTCTKVARHVKAKTSLAMIIWLNEIVLIM